jgi:hypothetical protein
MTIACSWCGIIISAKLRSEGAKPEEPSSEEQPTIKANARSAKIILLMSGF